MDGSVENNPVDGCSTPEDDSSKTVQVHSKGSEDFLPKTTNPGEIIVGDKVEGKLPQSKSFTV